MNRSPLLVTICIIGIALAACGIYFGALLPLLKSQAYIGAEQSLGAVQSVEDFENDFNNVFALYSPVGGPEVAQFLAGDILNIVESNQSVDVDRALVSYITPYLDPNDVLQLLILGQLNQAMWQASHQASDCQAAVAYYQKAHELGPELAPPPLYSLLALYQAEGDTVNAKKTRDHDPGPCGRTTPRSRQSLNKYGFRIATPHRARGRGRRLYWFAPGGPLCLRRAVA